MDDADIIETLFAKAAELHTQGRLTDALRLYDAVLQLNPSVPSAHSNRGVALHSLKRFDEALQSCNRAIELKPDYAEAYYNRGLILFDLKHLDEAIKSYDRAIQLKPDYAKAYNNRGNALKDLRRLDEALQNYSRTIELNPDDAKAWSNRGSVLETLGRWDEALQSHNRAIELDPNFSEAFNNRGFTLQKLRRLDEALHDYNHAIALEPNFARAYWNKGVCLLFEGHYDEGLRLFAHGRRLPSTSQNSRSYKQPVWSGKESISGKTLFIYHELYLGDMIQFCRYLKMAEAEGAKVIVSTQTALRSLLSSLSPTIEIISGDAEPNSFDYYCPLMSLPIAFKTKLKNIPSKVPYLFAPKERIESWRKRLARRGFRIGICWQGSRNSIADHRSFPLAEFRDIAKIPNVRLISLQKNDGVEQLDDLPAGMTVETLGDDFDAGPDAFIDTAAVMENLNLIITSDTAIAHVAGALGLPTWVALQYLPDWRWLLDRSDSPWYPTIRLFRQPSHNDWRSVFVEMEAELTNLVRSKQS